MRLLLSLLLLLTALPGLNAETTPVAKDGKALLPIHHVEGISDTLKTNVTEFAELLGKMSGTTFSVEQGGEPRGMIIGTIKEYPDAPGASKLDASDPLRREEYIIKSDGERLWLIGATEAGACHAMWDIAHRLGYRLYFPGERWEVVPTHKEVALDLDVHSVPDFKFRRFYWHYGNWRDVDEGATLPIGTWLLRNRMSSPDRFRGVFDLRTGHVYGGIIRSFQKEFIEELTMRSLVDGKPTSKLNPANPKTLEVIKQYADAQIAKNPGLTSLSMDPSDGGGWGSSEEELAIGTPSDRTVFMANEVASYINENHEGRRYVGIYAYNYHSPPPEKVRVDPRVVVSVATSFIRGGYTVNSLIKGWRDAGAEKIGVRDYHSVVAWDLCLPARGVAANPALIARRLPEYHQMGAEIYLSEAGLSWGPQGVGNYLTTRVLWDTDEAKRYREIVEEFVSNCFPQAREPMLRFYTELMNPDKRPPFTRDFIGRLYRTLDEALKLTDEPAATARLNDLIEYARYVELVYAYQRRGGMGPGRQGEVIGELLAFAYRTRSNRMVSSYAVFRDVPIRNRSIPRAKETDHRVAEGKNPWKNSDPVTQEERDRWLSEGIVANPVFDFEVVNFSQDLVSAEGLAEALGDGEDRASAVRLRYAQNIYTWVKDPEFPINFHAAGGRFYRTLGTIKARLRPMELQGEAAGGEGDEMDEAQEENVPVFLQAVASFEAPPDREAREVILKAERPGAHVVETRDQAGGFDITGWPGNQALTTKASIDQLPFLPARGRPVFYVPRGTKEVVVFSTGAGNIYDAHGDEVATLPKEAGYTSVQVQDGRDGAFWRLGSKLAATRVALLTVPPYLAPTPRQLMLPREVVEADMPSSTGKTP